MFGTKKLKGQRFFIEKAQRGAKFSNMVTNDDRHLTEQNFTGGHTTGKPLTVM